MSHSPRDDKTLPLSDHTFRTGDSQAPPTQQSAAPSTSPSSADPSPAVVLYKPATAWSLIRGAAINLLLPFINGMMLGFGELFAHEAAFRLGWGSTRVFPESRRAHAIGPGIEAVEKPRRRNIMDDLTSLE